MPLTGSRYDGHAEWYEQWNKPKAERNAAEIEELLGPGWPGPELRRRAVLRGPGLDRADVVGVDRSADQLRIARGRSRQVVQGDAAALPFADCTFSAVALLWVSTDVDDFMAVLAEAMRVLEPAGLIVFYGAHPCFNGPHAQWLDDGGVLAHPTYRQAGWHQEAPWWGTYIRRRVGMRQHPLAELLNAFLTTGLLVEHVAEPGDRPVPVILAIRARKPAAPAAS
jgi:SAM-dependent methyltransferase